MFNPQDMMQPEYQSSDTDSEKDVPLFQRKKYRIAAEALIQRGEMSSLVEPQLDIMKDDTVPQKEEEMK